MKDYIFIDSNIWIYSFIPAGKEKYIKVRAFLEECFKKYITVVSFQVINETICILKKKNFSELQIRNIIRAFQSSCVIMQFSPEQLIKSSELRETHNFSFWDSLIVSCAILSNSRILYTEDMQSGREIEGVKIINPFNNV
ncbi:MAG: PIN domain-containing protein [Candidatus Eremiobacterota bacterium]